MASAFRQQQQQQQEQQQQQWCGAGTLVGLRLPARCGGARRWLP
jgi:hypothetical protein